ncbi:MAG: arsenite efflux transporter metallochaperone ArsD [Verrucomicrobiota bacterium]|jgi:hypothetical protein
MTTHHVQVFDPPMCCSTGICGTDIDPDLVHFAAALSQLKGRGVQVERYNLSQQPLAFAQHEGVKAVLTADGTSALPLIYVDGTEWLRGRYPGREERPAFFRAALGLSETESHD